MVSSWRNPRVSELIAQLNNLIVANNDDDGIQIEESNEGNLIAGVANSDINDNAKFGIKAAQVDAGVGHLNLKNVDLSSNEDGELEVEGVIVAE